MSTVGRSRQRVRGVLLLKGTLMFLQLRAKTVASIARLAIVVAAGSFAIVAVPASAQQVRLYSQETWPRVRPGKAIVAPNVNGVVLLSGEVTNARIGPMAVVGAFRAVEQRDGVVNNLIIDGLTASDLQRDGVRIRSANGLTISNFDLKFRAAPQTGRNLPEGIALYGGGNIVIRNGVVDGFRMSPRAGTYLNGDGIATERGVRDAVIEDVTSSNNGDGGFDLKGTLRLDRLTAIGNGRNFRFWNTIKAGTLTSIDPRGASIGLAKGAVVVIEKLVVRQKTAAPILVLDGATITILSCDIEAPPGTKMARVESSGNRVTLGEGCALP